MRCRHNRSNDKTNARWKKYKNRSPQIGFYFKEPKAEFQKQEEEGEVETFWPQGNWIVFLLSWTLDASPHTFILFYSPIEIEYCREIDKYRSTGSRNNSSLADVILNLCKFSIDTSNTTHIFLFRG